MFSRPFGWLGRPPGTRRFFHIHSCGYALAVQVQPSFSQPPHWSTTNNSFYMPASNPPLFIFYTHWYFALIKSLVLTFKFTFNPRRLSTCCPVTLFTNYLFTLLYAYAALDNDSATGRNSNDFIAEKFAELEAKMEHYADDVIAKHVAKPEANRKLPAVICILDSMSEKIVKPEEECNASLTKIYKNEEKLEKLEGELKKQSTEIMGIRGGVRLLNDHVDNNIMKEVQFYLDEEEKRVTNFLEKGGVWKDINMYLNDACGKMFVGLKKKLLEEIACRPSMAVS